MKEVTAIMGWFTEVTIQVHEEDSPCWIKAKLKEHANKKLLRQEVNGPDVVESNYIELVDK
jgi:hypothetical protein